LLIAGTGEHQPDRTIGARGGTNRHRNQVALPLEEDDDLRAKWAALLANAATAEQGDYILPAYAEILRQLTPVQAKMLD
jgi:hypothetical protein